MSNVLTLIADPSGRKLEAAVVEDAAAALRAAGAETGEPDWLAPGIACDVPFTGLTAAGAEVATRTALVDQPYDLAAQPVSERRKRLLVADLEATIIAEEMLDELAEVVGLRQEISAVTERAMRGELDFETALAERVSKLAGMPAEALESTANRMRLNPGAACLVRTMRAHGAFCALVSGGFTCFAEPIAKLCGFQSVQANRLEIVDGRLTGRVVPPVLGREAKLTALRQLCSNLDIPLAQACAVGDGANDLAMLNASGLGVAYHAKPLVRAQAYARLDYADLTGVAYLQGFRQEDLVDGAA